MKVTLRPLPDWPYEPTSPRRYGQFKSGGRIVAGEYQPGKRVPYDRTLRELEYEVDQLDGSEIVIGVGLLPHEVRLDGMPRADAKQPRHPGVEISFDSRFGRLTYATDVFTDWRDNVRAIAKGLEALRAVDRWGVSKRGQQYAGFAQLSAGGPDPARGKILVERAGSIRAALMEHHPDRGGDAAKFADVQAYRESVGGSLLT